MTRPAYYGPSKEQIARAKKERKEARRRSKKDARTLEPVRYGDTGAITTERK